jgi:hypothetical protein
MGKSHGMQIICQNNAFRGAGLGGEDRREEDRRGQERRGGAKHGKVYLADLKLCNTLAYLIIQGPAATSPGSRFPKVVMNLDARDNLFGPQCSQPERRKLAQLSLNHLQGQKFHAVNQLFQVVDYSSLYTQTTLEAYLKRLQGVESPYQKILIHAILLC